MSDIDDARRDLRKLDLTQVRPGLGGLITALKAIGLGVVAIHDLLDERLPRPERQPDPLQLCACGHARRHHIHHEGACRYGSRCPAVCAQFVGA